MALLKTTDMVRRRLGRVVEAEGITLQQYNVLRILRGARGAPLSALEIRDRLIEETPGVSRLIDRLVAKSFVRRDRSLIGLVDTADADVLRGLSARALDTLIDLLAQINR